MMKRDAGSFAPAIASNMRAIDAVYDGHRSDGAVGCEFGMIKMS